MHVFLGFSRSRFYSSMYSRSSKRPGDEQLLHSVDGSVPEGAFCAFLGPSGSGKTTLIDLLTMRREFGRCSGEVLYNGSPVTDQEVSWDRSYGVRMDSGINMLRVRRAVVVVPIS